KTPLVFKSAQVGGPDRTLAVLRGYGGEAPAGGLLVSDGVRLLCDADRAGDEALLLAGQPGLRVAVGRNRRAVIENYAIDRSLIILDDAFQNPLVHHDHDLVLIDATVGVDRVRVFPRGRFRDTFEALERADTVLLTRVNQTQSDILSELYAEIEQFLPRKNIFESVHQFVGLEPHTRARRVAAFCGIGNPGAFFHALEREGYRLEARQKFPDHHRYKVEQLQKMIQRGPERIPWITTEKDWVRIKFSRSLKLIPDLEKRLHVMRMQVQILHGREEEFFKRILGKYYRSEIRRNQSGRQ
ncbi:MAG: tetraacyldisaccharide 4'-kinase, partial [Leptospiraceae bacterium]|nr:tetraacyldisaccharide 4'-kinase [Leptospiraceae bacterium]